MGSALLAWSPLITAALVALIYGAFRLINRRGGEKAKREPTWVELVDENRNLRHDLTELGDRFEAFVKEQKAKDRAQAVRDQAMRNILASAADQWPADHAGPVFDLSDIDALSDTVPTQWRRAPRPQRKAKPA